MVPSAAQKWLKGLPSDPQDLLVFSDLDGTLLDHHSYDASAALPALRRLQQLAIPVVMTSSKTAAELAVHHHELHLGAPFIFENGGGIAEPDAAATSEPRGFTVHLVGPQRERILRILSELRDSGGYRFQGFVDWSDEGVVERTGLSLPAAARARRRLCSEPIHWLGDASSLRQFRRELSRHGLRTVSGGRFTHVLGLPDKATAMSRLCKLHEQRTGRQSFTVALGDSPNDRDMLDAADRAVVVRRPDGSHLPLADTTAVLRTQGIGPEGWAEAMTLMLDALEGN